VSNKFWLTWFSVYTCFVLGVGVDHLVGGSLVKAATAGFLLQTLFVYVIWTVIKEEKHEFM
jgi:hypothetical protein